MERPRTSARLARDCERPHPVPNSTGRGHCLNNVASAAMGVTLGAARWLSYCSAVASSLAKELINQCVYPLPIDSAFFVVVGYDQRRPITTAFIER
jgi:hypothetical protein